MKTATDRAVEAIEAAEKIFADEMGTTLDLTAAAKTVLIATITAAIQAAVAEGGQQLTWVLAPAFGQTAPLVNRPWGCCVL